jgi:hypothetical protein
VAKGAAGEASVDAGDDGGVALTVDVEGVGLSVADEDAEAEGEGVEGVAVLPRVHADSATAKNATHRFIRTCSCWIAPPRI